ncbi:hypothetical protein L208DRAFT_838636 [Tricholoma matsutake]|nr:hypothetical protein L208DRAFT_838636 [Tricholoma matsutake 945]
MFHAQLMVGCLRVITKAFSDGSRAPEYALISWLYHACLFLSAPSVSEGLGGLKDEAEGLVKKIDVKWIKLWMIEALGWAGVPYFRVQLTQEKPRGLARGDGIQLLQWKLRSISRILEKFVSVQMIFVSTVK